MTMNINLNTNQGIMFRSAVVPGLSITVTVDEGTVKTLDGQSPLAELRDVYGILKGTRDEFQSSRKKMLVAASSVHPKLKGVIDLLASKTGESLDTLVGRYVNDVPDSPVIEKLNAEIAEVEGLIERAYVEDSGDSEEEGCGSCSACMAAKAMEDAGMEKPRSLNDILQGLFPQYSKEPEDKPKAEAGLSSLLEMLGIVPSKNLPKPLSQRQQDALFNFVKASAFALTEKMTDAISKGVEAGDDADTIGMALTNIAEQAGLVPEDVRPHYNTDEEFSDVPSGAITVPLSAFKGMNEADFKAMLQKAVGQIDCTTGDVSQKLGEALQKVLGKAADVRVISDPAELHEIFANAK